MYLPPVSEYMREIERREALVKPSLLKEMADGGAGEHGWGPQVGFQMEVMELSLDESQSILLLSLVPTGKGPLLLSEDIPTVVQFIPKELLITVALPEAKVLPLKNNVLI